MKLFNHKAEQLLLEKAKTINGSHDSWRCIYINFSERLEQYNEGLRTNIVTNILKNLIEINDGDIYLCSDGDIFILFCCDVTTILEHLGKDFINLGGRSDGINNQDNFYTVFDLKKNWKAFSGLCETKMMLKPGPDESSLLPQTQKTAKEIYKPDMKIFHAASADRGSRERPLVLLVEDDPFTRRLLRTALTKLFDIAEAGDSNSAIKAYESSAPDAVFLDIDLPDMNGHMILSKLLALDPSAFVVMLSAYSIRENILAALEKGAQGFVTKPFTKEKLLHYLNLCKTLRNIRYSL